MNKKILIACDHAGYNLKQDLIKNMPNITFDDMGTDKKDSVDYPDFANKLASKVDSGDYLQGILICGSGIGMSIAANRYKNVRAGLAFNSEIAKLMRKHNDANVLVLPGRFMDVHEAVKCINNFITNNFEGGRHIKRLKKIN